MIDIMERFNIFEKLKKTFTTEQSIKFRIMQLYYGGNFILTHCTSLKDFNERALNITTFNGHWGIAGYIFCVEGSPPKGSFIVFTNGIGKINDMYYYDNNKMGRCKRLNADSFYEKYIPLIEHIEEYISKTNSEGRK